MIEIVGTPVYIASESAKVFTGDQIASYERAGFKKVRGPRWETDPTIMGKPSKVLVTYMWKGEEKTADLKHEVVKAYNRYYEATGQDKIKSFTESDFERFVSDLERKRVIALKNKFEGSDIWFKVL